MKKTASFLFFCMIFAISATRAQSFSLKDTTSKGFHFPHSPVILFKKVENSPLPLVPANFYSSNLGFFCKKEWKFETATRLPFKFRLGSVSYNDWLERKPNSGLISPR